MLQLCHTQMSRKPQRWHEADGGASACVWTWLRGCSVGLWVEELALALGSGSGTWEGAAEPAS